MSKFICKNTTYIIADQKKKNNSTDQKKLLLIKKKKNIDRFLEAHKNGIKTDTKITLKNKTYNMDRSGVNFESVLKELEDNSIKTKKKHYIWYIFPQPEYKPAESSHTSKYFYIDEDEVRLFLKNKKLRDNLYKALTALDKKNFKNTNKLINYLNPDYDKFEAFRIHFLTVISKMNKENKLSLSTKSTIKNIEELINKLAFKK